ncbi:MAG: glucan biosynthesis protein G [Pseudomonadota bacterium]
MTTQCFSFIFLPQGFSINPFLFLKTVVIRRQFSYFACVTGLFFGLLPAPASAFDFHDVEHRARQLANQSFKKPDVTLPPELRSLDSEHYGQIHYKKERILWRDAKLPFEADFYPPGWHFDLPVKINEVTAQSVREIRFNPKDFDYGTNKVDVDKLRGLGFAGFRIRYPVNSPTRKDEVLSFLGASYFRALGKDQRYGLSARGLAIDTALGTGEEFPRFVEFWLLRPQATDKRLIIYGLLDSPRATGAYRFVLQPGVDTVMDVSARLYLRSTVGKLGLAPLTSMFYFGLGQHPDKDDFRPAVHDSDGLSIHMGNDEWIWRPLVNPKRLLVTSFTTTHPLGFGLMQRQRDFSDYEDPDLRYELRPSAWVEPKGNWGAGRVELVQIPTPDETNDNIVAYWVPDKLPALKTAYDFSYRILWQKDKDTHPPELWVAQTLHGRGYTHTPDGSISLAIDFKGKPPGKDSGESKPDGLVSVDSNGKLLEQKLSRNEATGGWRLTLRLQRLDANKPVELRASLRSGDKGISEIWSYIVPPD